MTGLSFKIALRYLFARKSFHVINMISGIGMAGMAVGTAALIVILSVFNGFRLLVGDSLSDAGAPLVVRPAAGKVFVPEGEAFDWAMGSDQVVRLSSVLEEQAFLSYEGKQCLARVKGVDEVAEEESPMMGHIIDGVWQLHRGEQPMAVCGASLAHTLGLNPRFVNPLEIHYPSRTEAISLANPAASLRSRRLRTAGVFSVNAELDAKLLLVPIEVMRDLLSYEKEVSALEIWPAEDAVEDVQRELSARLGPAFRVLDRERQNLSLFRMMRYEKLAIYLILVFIVLVIAFNIYSALKMLIIEKEADRDTLRSLGAPPQLIRRIFLVEGWLVSLVGMGIGLVLGLALVLLQQRFGLVPMPGNFSVTAYPVALDAADILWTLAGVCGIGFLMALIPSRQID